MGPSPISALAPLWNIKITVKVLVSHIWLFAQMVKIIVSDANLPSCFADVKTSPTKWNNYWGGLNPLTPVTPAAASSSAIWRTAQADLVPCKSCSPPCPWKMLCLNPWGAWGFSEHEPPHPLAWPCNKSLSAPKSYVHLCLASLCIRHMSLL